jgi:predicted nucleic acid-binding protein
LGQLPTHSKCLHPHHQPAQLSTACPLLDAIQTLQTLCQSPLHQFWPDDLSLLDAQAFDHSKIHGHRQLTDLYLLALAVKHHGCFVSFDRAIPLSAVKGAKKQHLVVL